MTDIATFGETMLRLSAPEGERLETARSLDVGSGGAESNVAVAASNLGADTRWCSRLPDSHLGRRVVRELRSHGVRTDVTWDAEARMGTYFVDFGGDPRGTDVIYDRADSAFTDVTPADVPDAVVEDATFVHTTGITPALSESAAATTAHLLETAQAAGTTTVFDLNYRAKLWDPETARAACEELFPDVDVLVVAVRDAEAVLREEGDPVEIARSLRDAHGFETVLLTRGEQGVLAVRDGEILEQPAYPADTLDAIGTGDAFVGGFLARRAEGGDVDESLAWGAATASLKRTIGGDLAVVSREEVESVVAEEEAGISR